MATGGTIAPSASASRNEFAMDIFKTIASDKAHTNLIFSPASIQSCLALVFFGAESDTAEEIRKALKLGAALNKEEIAQNYGEFLKSAFNSTSHGPQLKMANRLYVNESLEIKPKFNEIAEKYFQSQAKQVNFTDAVATVQIINSWVERQTENKIKNLLQSNAVDGETSAVLVNAIYFKGKWSKPFSKSSTEKADFQVNTNEKVSVDMMYLNEKLKFAELRDLDATALEMPYKNSELSMLIILPKSVEGLPTLEQRLANVDLNEITSQMKVEAVNVFLPKFKIEFDIDLKEPLKKLGMSSMFSDKANFSSLFTKQTPQKISEVKHKSFLDVNEAGSEAAAATYMKMVPMCLNLDEKTFNANHPFVFAIRSSTAVYFAGHVAKF